MTSIQEKGGGSFDMVPLPDFLRRHHDTCFLVNEALTGLAGESVAGLLPDHSDLLVTRTPSKAHSLAGFHVGDAISPVGLTGDLNSHNNAYSLTRPGQAAAMATPQQENRIRDRVKQLGAWTEDLAAELRTLDVSTHPTPAYFFLADFAPHDSANLADKLRESGVFVKPLKDRDLGPDFMRATTALPQENARVIAAVRGRV
ncbi:hypothetical protein TspCOW1_13650 [Thiohalobacter sp. COW1]|uniref:histidinol-phosphate transaminase n=1 Tax=Thiohalobacter thiocyanaticus TaxID=585455 RepID=A0A1Z4VQG1_9GAMM|nr:MULTISPECIES: aminotransferase class I/II-fold pyridoxal phosphate-dependent enzyme [Thiohalobacter]BAZ93652.1 histidinol-phosphate aminotransferase [Thiohalobacter thiocyanaticus]BCO31262.1 hypothetical protein TspCOW1_13650 [Thiohalobacter sp. COW1]